MKKIIFFGLFSVLLFAGCLIGPTPPPLDKCAETSECVCGMSQKDAHCVIGNKTFVEEGAEKCEEFCDLIENISCQKNRCEWDPISDEKFCDQDSDCACGVHYKTKECFFGNKNFVNTITQCPDFCTGIAGNISIKCNSETSQCEAVLP